jgi:hypothetical protein
MTQMIFDRQQDAQIGFGDGTVNIPIYTTPGALRHKPSSRTQLICRWHRRVQGPLTCVWTEVPSTPRDPRDFRLPNLQDEDGFASPWWLGSRLQAASRGIAITLLLTSAALGTFLCFVTEASVLS